MSASSAIAAIEPSRGAVSAWAAALRLHHWPKGAVVLVGLLPTGAFAHAAQVGLALAAAALFQLAASAGYLINDSLDARRDRLHPRKRLRPIASGRIGVAAAASVALALAAVALVGGSWLSHGLGLVLAAYLVITLAYSLAFKHAVGVDILVIAGVFVLRAIAGVVAIDAEISPLFLSSVGCLALLLALGKRLSEARLLTETAKVHRIVLRAYAAPGWRRVLTAVGAATIACYAVAATRSPTAVAHPALMLSVLPVFLGIWRYTRLVVTDGAGGEPERLLARDPWMLAAAASWIAVMIGAMLV